MSSIVEAAKNWNLDKTIVKNLRAFGINEFFEVQKAVIPLLLYSNLHPCIIPRDICVSAPTGSGKTLSYVLPIVQTLLTHRLSTGSGKLSALIVLPSRELAVQVHNVLLGCIKSDSSNDGIDTLSVGIAAGGSNNSSQSEEFVRCTSHHQYHNHDERLYASAYSNDNLYECHTHHDANNGTGTYTTSNVNYISTIDILVCTPGRLLFHIQHTTGFTLSYLQFLVLDEADRLLG